MQQFAQLGRDKAFQRDILCNRRLQIWKLQCCRILLDKVLGKSNFLSNNSQPNMVSSSQLRKSDHFQRKYHQGMLLRYLQRLYFLPNISDPKDMVMDILSPPNSKNLLGIARMSLFHLRQQMDYMCRHHTVWGLRCQRGSNDLKDKHITALIPWGSKSQRSKQRSLLISNCLNQRWVSNNLQGMLFLFR